MQRILFFGVLFFFYSSLLGQQKTYIVTSFGAKADGASNNASAIQTAINTASAAGGGIVIIPKGRFVTGTIEMKSNVEMRMEEGAILQGSDKRKDYDGFPHLSLIIAIKQHNISITGKGTVDGKGRELIKDILKRLEEGTLTDPDWKTKRPQETNRTSLIYFEECTDIKISDVFFKDASSWVTHYERCRNIIIDNIKLESMAYWNNDGIDIVDCKNMRITNSFINSADDAICLKSSGVNDFCDSIYVENCTLRSSANAFKLGTGSKGGFKNITVRNLTIYNTYRSAIALEAVDGGFLENIDIRNVAAKNTGNAIFIKLGHRNNDNRYSSVKNIYIGNVKVEVPIGKPDAGYELEGPLLKYPPTYKPEQGKLLSVSPWNKSAKDSTAIIYEHNVFPSSVSGLPDHPVENVVLENIEVIYNTVADKNINYFPLDSFQAITEAEKDYPEFSMFGELPVWGFYVRHVNGLTLKNITVKMKGKDFRTAYLFNDVKGFSIEKVKSEGSTAKPDIFYNNVGKADTGLLQYVQPLSGTASATTISAIKHSEAGGTEANANTIPAVTLPFAMTQWTAQTRTTEVKCQPPYYYKDSLLNGFRGTHWLSGSCTQDYGSFTIMPVAGKLKTTAKEYAVPFSHSNEITTPAYYKLTAANIVTEITSTLRCGMMQFTIQQDDSLYLLIMPNSDKAKGFVKVDAAKGEVWGYNPAHRIYQGWGEPAGLNGWFYIKIEKVITNKGTFSSNEIFSIDSIINKKDAGGFVGFKMNKGEVLRISIGTSFSSLEGAKKNLATEVGSKNFEEVLAIAKQKWETALSQIKVETNIEKDKRIFYTALYHSMQHPRLMSDVDGTYPKFAGNYELKKMKDSNYYDDFSMWDIYRAQLPLFEILKPELSNQFVQSLILKGEQGGWLPIFPCWNSYTAAMIGDHVTAYIASAYNKGIRNYDVNAAYKLMRKNAFETPATFEEYKNGMGRRALPSYLKYGFIPMEDSVQEAFHKKEQVSRTLEYAFDDYALSVIAKGLNKTDDYKKLLQRSFNYKNVFDKSVNMVRGKYANGGWIESFTADKREAYITEGTPRQYTFYVPQDIPGLAKLMGGTKQLENSLDSLFTKNEYWHGNEPGHQIPFMYNYTASPWKTQREVIKILAEEYSDGPGGLSGNDDAGQMSAWYVFAAMGFYPLNPVSGEYLLATPLFDKISIQLTDKNKFEIITYKSSAAAKFISKARWNGKVYGKNFITHSLIKQGGKLELWLTDKPTIWGSTIKSQPTGLTPSK